MESCLKCFCGRISAFCLVTWCWFSLGKKDRFEICKSPMSGVFMPQKSQYCFVFKMSYTFLPVVTPIMVSGERKTCQLISKIFFEKCFENIRTEAWVWVACETISGLRSSFLDDYHQLLQWRCCCRKKTLFIFFVNFPHMRDHISLHAFNVTACLRTLSYVVCSMRY